MNLNKLDFLLKAHTVAGEDWLLFKYVSWFCTCLYISSIVSPLESDTGKYYVMLETWWT